MFLLFWPLHLKHVKSAHLLASLVSQANHVVLSLWLSSLCVFLPSFILVTFLGGMWTWCNSILTCLSVISCVLICFIGSFKSSRMRSRRLFTYPLIELFETSRKNQYGSFSSYCAIGVCVILEEVIHVNSRFLFTLGGLWWVTGLLLRRSLFVFHLCPILTTH